jgi:hypothetical protein
MGSPLTCSTSASSVVASPPNVKPPVLSRRSIAPTGDPIGFTHSGFVQERILAACGARVVGGHGRLRRTGRQSDVAFEVGDGVGHPGGRPQHETWDHEAIASSWASPSMIRYAVLSCWYSVSYPIRPG